MRSTDVLITSLPTEVLEQILENDILQISDVTSFALTCKHLYWTVTTSNKLWRTKFYQRWPLVREVLEDEITPNEMRSIDWREETIENINCRRLLIKNLSGMSAKHYGRNEISVVQMSEYDELSEPALGARITSYHYLMDELQNIVEEPITKECNLMHKYYALKVIRHLKQAYLTKKWKQFLALPLRKQTTEFGAILVAQWSQPEKRVSARKVYEMLDDIAQQTRESIAENYPEVPINEVPREELARWKVENLYDNQWSNEDSKTIVSVLCEVMFHKLSFHGNSEMYYSSINSFIDQVLIHKRGIPITLAIVFESVARRLGLHCETVSFPAHFLLRWKQRYIPRTKEDEEAESYYIDVFNGGQFLTRNNCSGIAGATRCPIEKNNVHRATSAIKVVQRMANNLEVAGRQRTQLNGRAARLRSALELLNMVKPRDTNTILHLARFYMLHQMKVDELIETLNDMLNTAEEEEDSRGQAKHILQMLVDYKARGEDNLNDPLPPKKRTPDIKYAIGMIMTDRLQNQCVITGWDPACDDTCEPEYELLRDPCDRSMHGIQQTFYHIHVEDGSCRRAPEGSLLITGSPVVVDNSEIGRFFCKYMGSFYLPNDEKAREYPEDAKFRDEILSMYSQAHSGTSQ